MATHFHVTRKAADALNVVVLDILQHQVLIRTKKGPRFMSRKKFDIWEVQERQQKPTIAECKTLAPMFGQ